MIAMQLTAIGLDEVKKNFGLAPKAAVWATKKALTESVKVVETEAKIEAPYKTGYMRSRIKGFIEKLGWGYAGRVECDAPYAWYQHENLFYKHKAGKKAMFLRGPLNREQGRMAKRLAKYVVIALRRRMKK